MRFHSGGPDDDWSYPLQHTLIYFFSSTAILLALNWRKARLSLSEYIPLLLSICLYALLTLSNILEHSGITDFFDPLEDVGELVFLFICLLFINNWRSNRAMEVLRQKEAKLSAALEMISKKEQEYRLLVENSNDAICILQDEKVAFCNSRTLDLLGCSYDEVISSPFTKFIHPDDRSSALKTFYNILTKADDPLPIYTFKIITGDGEERIVHLNAVFVEWNESPATLNFVRDITEQVKFEQNLHRTQKMESIGTLAGGIAHDFNNILAAIIGYTELARESLPQQNPVSSHLEKVLSAGNRAKELVKQILTFSSQAPHKLEPVEIHLVVLEALKLLRSTIPSTIEIRQDIDTDSGLVLSDSTQIHQIVMNLCTNAYHAMRKNGGILAVSLKKRFIGKDDFKTSGSYLQPGFYIELVVSDTGAGMRSSLVDHIFDPYFTTKKKGEGTGLGLSVVHGIVQNYGGHISVYSEYGKGSTFHIYLPAVTADAPGQNFTTDSVCPMGNEKVLVVDDEEILTEMMEQMLTSLGYGVTAITDSNQAFQTFKDNPSWFDVIITDMTMPNLDGSELIKKVKEIRKDIPILLCTGFSELIDGEKAEALGVQKFLMKPVVRMQLATAIRDVLDA